MEVCKKVQAEEYVIHVEKSTCFCTHLRFSLLASTWLPRPLGVCLWSVLYMPFVLPFVLYEAPMLLVLFPIVFVLAVLMDAITSVWLALCFFIGAFLAIIIMIAPVWLWRVITCDCCTICPQAQDPGAAAADGPCAYFEEICRDSITLRFVNHVILVSFPYRREKLEDLFREIVPWYDTIVV